jgi:D-glycero-D-manno-heptose 1,7-bisphosphate phosphatase
MIEKAIARFQLNPDACFMIGDKDRDVEAANGAGVKGFKLRSNPSLEELMACFPN